MLGAGDGAAPLVLQHGRGAGDAAPCRGDWVGVEERAAGAFPALQGAPEEEEELLCVSREAGGAVFGRQRKA